MTDKESETERPKRVTKMEHGIMEEMETERERDAFGLAFAHFSHTC